TQAEYIIKTLISPIVKGSFEVIDVKEAAENRDANFVQDKLKGMVWSSGCANWNLNASGRNTTNYHDPTWKFWWELYWPVWKDFNISGGSGSLPVHPFHKMAFWGVSAGVAISAVAAGVRTHYLGW
ncbi:hypothetical protein ACHAPT_013674, partial [Fusarium lateritium]